MIRLVPISSYSMNGWAISLQEVISDPFAFAYHPLGSFHKIYAHTNSVSSI